MHTTSAGEGRMGRGAEKPYRMSPMPHPRRYITRARHAFQDEQQKVQAKTFSNWMNSYLCKCEHPLQVIDLIEDISDGKALLSLLEALTGKKLPESKGPAVGRPRHISNISTALEFLKRRGVRLVNINASDIADGKPPIVLGLIWTIILHFHIGGSSADTPASPCEEESSSSSPEDSGIEEPEVLPTHATHVACEQTLAVWTEGILDKQGLQFRGFGEGWQDGLAFLALIQHVQPGLVDMEQARALSSRDRLEQAFTLAQDRLGVPRLLDPADVDVDEPDGKSVMTYVAQFRNHMEPFRHPGLPHKGPEKEERSALLEHEEITLEMEKIKQSVTILRHQIFDMQEQALREVESQSLEGVHNHLTSLQSHFLQLLQHFYLQLKERLQHTESLLDHTNQLADSYQSKELGDTEENIRAVPGTVTNLTLLLTQLKGRLDDVISAVDEDLTKASSLGSDKEVTRFITQDALQVLLQEDDPPASPSEGAPEEDSGSSLLSLFAEINASLSKLDKEEFTADFFEGGEGRKATEEAITALAKHFALEGDFTTKLGAFVEKMISVRKALVGHYKTLRRQRKLHAYLTEQPKEEEALKQDLFQLESELKGEEGAVAWFNMEEVRDLHTGMQQTLDAQRDVIAQIREVLTKVLEMKDPSLQCAASLETKMAQMGACLRSGDDVLRSLKLRGSSPLSDVAEEAEEDMSAQGSSSPERQQQQQQEGGGAGPRGVAGCLGERRVMLDTWAVDAELQLHQAGEDLGQLKTFHPNVDEEQVRKGLSSVKDKIKLVQRLGTGALIKQEFGEAETRHLLHLESLQRALVACRQQPGKELPPLAAQLRQLHKHPSPSVTPELDEAVVYLSEVLASGERSLATMGDLGRLLKSVTGEATLLGRRDGHLDRWQSLYNSAVRPDTKEADDLHTLISQCLFLLLLVSFWLGQLQSKF